MSGDTSTFPEEVLKSAEPVLVSFSIEGCTPGEMIAPGLEQINAELAGKVKVVKLDMAENPELVAKYGKLVLNLAIFEGR
ncbi:thioredoxin [Sinorhizobium meliloti]|nr:thioredoxin domain-containing protein [Sinorhizobium meliloti]MDE4578327.1 thioredoxin [Sinorhizobium meliloti]MDW9473438.1 thiol reductase thioredoxin [Sinorhizobium meliloti]RVP23590.1 thiol reductase thioredoxin [Sinorhizobium meliloti]